MKFQVFGLREAKTYLSKKKKETEKLTKKGLTKATVYLQGEVKESIAGRKPEKTSVDTGRFLNSVDFKVTDLKGMVFTKIPYAKYLEYGTSKIKPRKHFRNSKSRSKGKIKELIQEEVNKL